MNLTLINTSVGRTTSYDYWMLYAHTATNNGHFEQLQHYSILHIQLDQLLLHIQYSSVDSNPVGQFNTFLCSSTLMAEILYHESKLGSSFHQSSLAHWKGRV